MPPANLLPLSDCDHPIRTFRLLGNLYRGKRVRAELEDETLHPKRDLLAVEFQEQSSGLWVEPTLPSSPSAKPHNLPKDLPLHTTLPAETPPFTRTPAHPTTRLVFLPERVEAI